MKAVRDYIFKKKSSIILTDLGIGGIGLSTNTKELLAAKFINHSTGLTYSASDIYDFSIDVDNNISCKMAEPYRIANYAFQDNLEITYFHDNDGFCVMIGMSEIGIGQCFRDAINLISVSMLNCTTTSANAFFGCSSLVSISLPKLQFGNAALMFYQTTSLIDASFPLASNNLDTSRMFERSNIRNLDMPNITNLSFYVFRYANIQGDYEFLYTTGRIERTFESCGLLTSIYMPLINEIKISSFNRATSIKVIDMPSVTKVTGNYNFHLASSVELINLPKCVQLGDTVGQTNVFDSIKIGCVINVDRFLETCNGGLPDGDLTYAINSKGATVNYIDN